MSIVVKDLAFTYSVGTPYEKKAISNINLTINEGDFLGIVGHTGSGKSTFIQHLNGLIKVQEGEIEVFDIKLTNAKKPKPDYRKLRANVGMVFQYPEYQLFEDTVYKDVAFGPKNLGLDEAEIDKRVKEAIELVGLDFESVKDRAPFELSGGQKRRVAIAGIIAMKPKVLVFDESTAMLDPQGRKEVMEVAHELNKEGMTVICITHYMEEALGADRLIVLNDGKIALDGKPKEVFSQYEKIKENKIHVPLATQIAISLDDIGIKVGKDIMEKDELVDKLCQLL